MRLLPVILLSTAHGGVPNPSWSPGNPVATLSSIILHGDARFTLLTDCLLRIEAGAAWNDGQTSVVWNRALATPAYTSNVSPQGVLTLSTDCYTLTYNGSGLDLSVELHPPSAPFYGAAVWDPSQTSAADPGNLFGTFHTLDGGPASLNLNCTQLDPLSGGDVLSFYPCAMGLVSKSGWAVVDDSRTPLLSPADSWFHPRMDGQCAAPSVNDTPCLLGQWNIGEQDACEAAGCCWTTPTASTMLNLYYSAGRQDHFTDATCAGCGDMYTFLHAQGYAFPSAVNGTIPLNLYWNAAPSGDGLQGTSGDNVASTIPPTQPGYNFVRIQAYIYDPALPQPDGTVTVKLYYSGAEFDHWTTASPADEAAAEAAGYSFVATMGYMVAPNATVPNNTGYACYQRSGNTDLYLFAHGSDYAAAVRDFTAISGPVSIPRRHFLGISFSFWSNSATQEVVYEQVQNLTAAGFPLDTYIYDMQWHIKPFWGAYTVDAAMFPQWQTQLDWLHNKSLWIGVNLHDADGVRSCEAQYTAMALANGVDPTTNATIEFAISNLTYASSLHNIVLEPLAAQGIDFWWTDFQQGLPGTLVANFPPTMALNHYRFQNSTGSARRGLTHSRFGGLGSHRYPTHFGGDVTPGDWATLQFMITFTATASNVAVCWWGHEMMSVGGSLQNNSNDEEFVRTMQFGAWSPVYTNWGNDGESDYLWTLPEPFQTATRNTLIDRNTLLPYRYTLAKISYDTGLCSVRPMYYDFPNVPEAYTALTQYMFGPDILASPIFSPMNATGYAQQTVWLPPGSTWLLWSTGEAYEGGQWVTQGYDIYTVPVFVRAGSIIARLPATLATVVGAATRAYPALEFHIHTSDGAPAATWVYEDDGMSNDYVDGAAYTNTSVTVLQTAAVCSNATMVASGSYANMPSTRAVSFFFLFAQQPSSVTADNVALPQSSTDGVPGTWYMAASGPRVYLQPAPTLQQHTVLVC